MTPVEADNIESNLKPLLKQGGETYCNMTIYGSIRFYPTKEEAVQRAAGSASHIFVAKKVVVSD